LSGQVKIYYNEKSNKKVTTAKKFEVLSKKEQKNVKGSFIWVEVIAG